MRVMYLLNLVLLGSDVWPQLLHPAAPLQATNGVAYSFWASLSALSAMGLRYPLTMMPLLLMQLLYKMIWLLAVALPLRSRGASFDIQVLQSGSHQQPLHASIHDDRLRGA